MPEAHGSERPFGKLASRALEVLLTHNEPVPRNDLACALGVSGAEAWAVAAALHTLGYANLDESHDLVEATPSASELLSDEAVLALQKKE